MFYNSIFVSHNFSVVNTGLSWEGSTCFFFVYYRRVFRILIYIYIPTFSFYACFSKTSKSRGSPLDGSSFMLIVPVSHLLSHTPQPMHFSWFTTAMPSSMEIALNINSNNRDYVNKVLFCIYL